jgi:hypothetical protein
MASTRSGRNSQKAGEGFCAFPALAEKMGTIKLRTAKLGTINAKTKRQSCP